MQLKCIDNAVCFSIQNGSKGPNHLLSFLKLQSHCLWMKLKSGITLVVVPLFLTHICFGERSLWNLRAVCSKRPIIITANKDSRFTCEQGQADRYRSVPKTTSAVFKKLPSNVPEMFARGPDLSPTFPFWCEEIWCIRELSAKWLCLFPYLAPKITLNHFLFQIRPEGRILCWTLEVAF